jgi:ubiquinone/menaquinone biosynthesis C-methylase UbiE
MTLQKEVFVATEGDAWFRRNEAALAALDWSNDAVSRKVQEVADGKRLRILEIGCGEGSRLAYLASTHGHEVTGLDPSLAAVTKAQSRGVAAMQGTADKLPFDASAFDMVIFGFCLYLCDDADLFRIAAEADRVLAAQAWLLILDFEAPAPSYRPYHHFPGMQSRKMDNKQLFLWHPAYTLASHEKFHHATHRWTDDPAEWVSLACLRKFANRK